MADPDTPKRAQIHLLLHSLDPTTRRTLHSVCAIRGVVNYSQYNEILMTYEEDRLQCSSFEPE